MTLSNGRHQMAIPGPSIMPDRVLQAMHRPAPNIYEGEIVEITESLVPDLRAVARTEASVAIYIANGHGAWEAALCNVLSPGDTVLVLATGFFASGWGRMAAPLGVEIETLDFGPRAPASASAVTERLRADGDGRIKAVLMVQTDTASSVRNDIAAIRRAMDAAGHAALLMVDCIACLGCDAFEMDGWGVDVMVAGSQKGLMTPPGLGFVFFNGKADAARDHASCVTAYWDWRPRTEAGQYYQYFCGTAPTHHIFALREALTMLVREEGVEAAWARHAVLARAIWSACEVWGEDGPLELNIANPAHRSHAVTSLRIGAPFGMRLRQWLTREAGVTLGIGLGMAPPESPERHGFFRIGHMGHLNAHGVLGTLGAIEAGLVALGIPHRSGGVSAAAEICATATGAVDADGLRLAAT